MNSVTLSEAIVRLTKGEVGIVPTDTVYGLVALASHRPAVQKFYDLKNRERKPGTLIASDIEQLLALGVPLEEIETVAQWWPNPLSAVLSVNGSDHLHQGVGTLAMRVVAHADTQGLLRQSGPLITSSANQPGHPPATNLDEAFAYFGDTVDFYVDGGVIQGTLPSTIIRPTSDGIEILRQGSISL